ncbi:hypothetical protein IGI04_004115, partial [Brassica rapa subsp. trilocularis]
MASATVDVGIGLMLSLLENETLLMSGVHSEIEMKKEVLIIKSFLEDTHKQDGNGSTITTATTTQLFPTFAANTKDVAYQVSFPQVYVDYTLHSSEARKGECLDSFHSESMKRGVKTEEVADGYFGRSKVFKMHDVIKEIALSISKAERLCGKEMRSGTVSRTNLPSILVCTKFELPPILRLLRSLDLEGSGINKLPDFWLTLFNLKYLNLSKTKVKELLRDFHRLINLETLNTKHSKRGSQLQKNAIHYIQTLPKLVWLSLYNAHMGTRLCFDEGFENLKILDKVQMQHLTEVVIEDGVMFGLQKLYVKARRVLESVQKGIENLVNLQELHLSHVSDQLVDLWGRGCSQVEGSRTFKRHPRDREIKIVSSAGEETERERKNTMPELSPAKLDRASSSSSSSSSDRTSVKIEEIEGGRCSAVVNGSEEVESKPDPAVASIADDAVSESSGKKLKLLNRIATVKHDGTVEFDVPADAIPQPIPVDREEESSRNGVCPDESIDGEEYLQYIPPMQIVMLIVGTRGDVQPFVAIAKRLQEYGHRVRLATHANFKEFVLTAGLEFYPLGGDPKVLAECPSEIQIQRKQMKDIINSLLPACKEPDPDSGNSFKADAIIANPPAYGHTHVAEALRIPIHVFFTMPWTPTSEFPHPLSRVKQPAGYRLSYHIVDSLIWLGIRDMIKDLRKKKLKLRPVSYLSGTQGSGSNIPHGYMWSPNLVPKPKDWGPQIDVVGFCFLDLASNYEPPAELVEWLEAGDKPIYIGFGSLPVQEPEKMTEIIVEALERTKQRGIINKGWGGLGNLKEPKDFVYLLDNVPHDWLFPRCKAVVHHGGAGTTAAGLKAACPTTIVPFFGDQPFWGERVHARGVGPAPIPVDEFSLHKLEDAINFMLDEKVKSSAETLAKEMKDEDGVAGAVKAFFKHLPSTQPISPDQIPEPSGLLSFRR